MLIYKGTVYFDDVADAYRIEEKTPDFYGVIWGNLPKPKTNFDHITASPERLAAIVGHWLDCGECPLVEEECDHHNCCYRGALKWLNQASGEE